MFRSGSASTSNVKFDIPHCMCLEFSKDCLFDESDNTFIVGLPYPIHKPLKSSEIDNCKKLLDDRAKYNEKIKFARQKYLKKTEYSSKEVKMPKGLLELYSSKGPDKDFPADYNYYYTGGFLQKVTLDNCEFLIRSNCENSLCLNGVHVGDEVVILDFKAKTPVLSLHTVPYKKDALLVVREKCTLTVLNLKPTKAIEILWVINRNGVTPFLDAKFNRANPNHLGFIDINLRLSVRDIFSRSTDFTEKFVDTHSNLNFLQFEFLNVHELLLMEEYMVIIVNYKSGEILKTFDPELALCNSLCTFKIIDTTLLLASRHYVLRTDLRYFEEPIFFSHTLKHPPCFMDIFQNGEDTFLCVASYFDNEKILFTGNSLYSIPFKVPGVRNTLTKARLENEDLTLVRELNKRVEFANMGLKFVKVENEVYIYSCNILGDIFRQTVLPSSSDTENTDIPVFRMLQWVTELEQPEAKLYITSITDMSGARFSLNKPALLKNSAKYEGYGKKAQVFLSKNLPNYSKYSTVNELAIDFITLWEDDDESVIAAKSNDLPEVPVHEKVANWVENQEFQDDRISDGTEG